MTRARLASTRTIGSLKLAALAGVLQKEVPRTPESVSAFSGFLLLGHLMALRAAARFGSSIGLGRSQRNGLVERTSK